jgi:hypothetical protein
VKEANNRIQTYHPFPEGTLIRKKEAYERVQSSFLPNPTLQGQHQRGPPPPSFSISPFLLLLSFISSILALIQHLL